jgi:hypothetical protein
VPVLMLVTYDVWPSTPTKALVTTKVFRCGVFWSLTGLEKAVSVFHRYRDTKLTDHLLPCILIGIHFSHHILLSQDGPAIAITRVLDGIYAAMMVNELNAGTMRLYELYPFLSIITHRVEGRVASDVTCLQCKVTCLSYRQISCR